MASKNEDFLTANVTVDHAVEAWSGHSVGSEGGLRVMTIFFPVGSIRRVVERQTRILASGGCGDRCNDRQSRDMATRLQVEQAELPCGPHSRRTVACSSSGRRVRVGVIGVVAEMTTLPRKGGMTPSTPTTRRRSRAIDETSLLTTSERLARCEETTPVKSARFSSGIDAPSPAARRST